ncbi:GLOBIN domain-containing protein [Trichostrongylus colubriformis]|uniref:GLOBIN domain-containing protein n=1 Tax=Trichostrongylus colubriformis TaxID=6319 RepID=A0AAN8F4W4_TRICO
MGLSQSSTNQQKKEKVERLFRRNVRSNRSRSLDCRNDRLCTRPVGGSNSARQTKYNCRLLEDGANGTISGLSHDEKRMIEMCWLKCTQRQLRRCSEDIFADILHQDESLLSLFKLESVPIARLRDHEYFKSHAANFAIVLNLVITNLQNNFEQTCEALQTLGYQHIALKSRGFQSMYWDIFTDCFEQNRPLTFRKEAEREAWSRMILFILSQMKIGYHRGAGDRKIGRQSVPMIF